MSYADFSETGSGLQVKDVAPGKPDAAVPRQGDTVVLKWEGYTIGYFGRPFESRKLNDLDRVDQEALRFVVGDGTVVPAIDEGVRGMREGGVRQMVVPVELGYDAE